MARKDVKIIGLSIKEDFGTIKATELKFDAKNQLTVFKGEVGSGKTTLNKAMRLTTQGSNTLVDKNLYGSNINMVAQLVDGDKNIFVGCKGGEGDTLSYFLYEEDDEGKKVKDPVIDGVKATPAAYLKTLQTALTWRLDELTSENPTTQRNLLLELYSKELEVKGVVFDKKSPKYVGGIIDQIEKAKERRSYYDMKRKEVGGIADDMQKKGVDYESGRLKEKDVSEINTKISSLESKKQNALDNPQEEKDKKLLELKNQGLEFLNKLRAFDSQIKERNRPNKKFNDDLEKRELEVKKKLKELRSIVEFLLDDENLADSYVDTIAGQLPELKPKELEKELEFNEKGSCISKSSEFENEEVSKCLKDYLQAGLEYSKLQKSELEKVDTSKYDSEIEKLQEKKKFIDSWNKDVKAVNSFYDWRELNEVVNDLNKEYFNLLTGINTGVKGLQIAPEYDDDGKGGKVARGNDIYLMYDGSYDPKYFSNEDRELRKLSAYSDTQKPMICLLIQNHLLSKKPKALPYLWIDQVPIDKKTRALLEKMSKDLDLWLFVNWTGDFDKDNLQDGEILIENGEIFQKEIKNED